MEEPRQQTLNTDGEETLVVGGEEATLVAPRFDDEETLVARPVVPLEEEAHATAQDIPAAHPAPAHRSPYGPRRSWMLALMLVSVLVGGVLGGAGFYFYQRQSQDSGEVTRPAASAEAAQPTAAPAAESPNAETPAEPAAQPSDAQASGASAPEERPAPAAETPVAAPATREPETVPAAERRETPAEGGGAVTPKRGKKGERDQQEPERRAAPRTGGNVTRADDNNAPEARRVDSISYRPRRAARRARRDEDAPDRLRRIFEGAPQ